MWAHVVRRHLWRSAGGAQEIREVRAGEAHEAALEDLPGPVDSRNATVAFATRAGGAREVEEIADNFTEEDAAILERLQHSSKRLE